MSDDLDDLDGLPRMASDAERPRAVPTPPPASPSASPSPSPKPQRPAGRPAGLEVKRCTRGELEERIEAAAHLLARGHTEGQVSIMLRNKYKVSKRTTQIYISRARAMSRALLDLPVEDIRADLYNVLRGAIADQKSSPRDRISAVEVAMRLFGIDQMPPAVNVNIETVIPIIELEVESRDDLNSMLNDPQFARLAYAGKLPGVPADRARAALESQGLIVNGKLVEPPRPDIETKGADALDGLEYDEIIDEFPDATHDIDDSDVVESATPQENDHGQENEDEDFVAEI